MGRVLTKDRQNNGEQSSKVLWIVMKIMIKPQRQVDHLPAFGDDLGFTAEAGDKVANVAVVLFYREEPAPMEFPGVFVSL
jgi:hypothetical protein